MRITLDVLLAAKPCAEGEAAFVRLCPDGLEWSREGVMWALGTELRRWLGWWAEDEGWPDLRGAALTGASLEGADLEGADMEGAALTGANLRRAYLEGADLRGADMTEADLRRADLRRANMAGADLTGADLWGANLTGADLEGAHRGLDPHIPGWVVVSGLLRREAS